MTEEPIALRSSSTAQEDPPPPVPNQCNAETWAAFEQLVVAVTGHPVLYGPGRGIWDADLNRFVVTYAPGRRSHAGDEHTWPNALGKRYPALHCTSWTNLFLGWLLRRNQDYTHAGNIPDLGDLLAWPPEARWVPGAGVVSGYGDACFEIESNGSTAARVRALIDGKAHIDAVELYERRAELPTFVVFMQSTKFPSGWMEWHHTGLFVFRDGRMYRIAADGLAAKGVYSAQPMRWTEITTDNISDYDVCRYRAWGVATTDGSYGDTSRPIAPVDFES